MNKTLKILLVAVLMGLMLIALTGCGNKLVATRTHDEDGEKYEEKLEITFKKDKVSNLKASIKFDSKDKAEEYVEQYNAYLALAKSFSDDSDLNLPELKQKGKTIIMEMDAEQYAELNSKELASLSKEEVKKQLEEEGYKVK